MNHTVIENFSKIKPTKFYLPLALLFIVLFFLFTQDSLNAKDYVNIQKNAFLYLNHFLGQFTQFENNITQLGDASIILSFVIIFLVLAPKIWESLLSASLVSLFFSRILKSIFWVPRPSQIYDESNIIIIGKKAVGFSSLPSGHAITIFTTLTVLLFAFFPKSTFNKIVFSATFIIVGATIALSRVGVGAHHPLDVFIGSILGYMCGLIGIFISMKYKLWNWIQDKKYYPILILLILGIIISVLIKIFNENLIIYYFTLLSLIITLYQINHVYFKK